MKTGVITDKRKAILQGIWFEGALFARIWMHTIWITVWYQSLMDHRADWQASGLLVFLALLGSTILARLFNLREEWRPGLRQAVFAVWILLIFMASLKWLVWPDMNLGWFETIRVIFEQIGVSPFDFGLIWDLLLMAVLIWQGVSLANSRGSLADTIRGFKIGILLLILNGLFYTTEINLVNSLPVMAFLALGLIATSVNRMADLIPLRGGRLPTSTGTWWAAIVAAALLLTAISLALVGTVEVAIRIGVFILIGLGFLPVLFGVIGIALAFGWILSVILPQFSLPVADFVDSMDDAVTMAFYQERLMKNMEKAGRHSVGEYLLPAIGILAVLIVIVLIFVALRPQIAWRRRVVLDENVSSIFDRFRLRLRREPKPDDHRRDWAGARRLLAAARIRRIYAGLLDLCEKVGSPRPPALTPLEFLPILTQTFPDHASGAGLITSAYLKVRYGGFPESAEEVEQVENAWKAILAQGRLMILARKRAERQKPKD
jgi:hypothetical protein